MTFGKKVIPLKGGNVYEPKDEVLVEYKRGKAIDLGANTYMNNGKKYIKSEIILEVKPAKNL